MADVAELRARAAPVSMPRHMASKQVSASRCACTGGLPTKYMRLVSPWKPSLMTVTSMLTMSPALSRLSFGMPWQTTWLTEVHIVFGKAAVIEVRRDRVLHVDDVVVADAVELLGRDAGHHVLADHVEHLGGQAAGDRASFACSSGVLMVTCMESV